MSSKRYVTGTVTEICHRYFHQGIIPEERVLKTWGQKSLSLWLCFCIHYNHITKNSKFTLTWASVEICQDGNMFNLIHLQVYIKIILHCANYTSCEELTHWKRLWEGLGAGGEGDDRGWDGWMASLTWWTWVWVNSWSWWWTGRPGVLRFLGSQRVGHNWATELNWTELHGESLSNSSL